MTGHVTTPPGQQRRRSAMNAWIRALDYTRTTTDTPGTMLCAMLDDLAAAHGDGMALLGEDEHFSFSGLAARANRYARWAIAQNLAPGDVVCLLMANCPDYAAIWLGLGRA